MQLLLPEVISLLFLTLIVGKNKAGICSACKKKAGDTGVTVMGVLALIGGAIWTGVKTFTKKD